jgi:Predicted drug exporters of the RND superfamily
MKEPIRTHVNPSHTVATVEVPLVGKGNDAASVRALGVLRHDVVPASLGSLQAAVTGETAGDVDFNHTNRSRAPIVFAFVLVLAFVLLLVTFRSLVIPLEAIVLNLLSVGAAYGVLVWIFQDGHLQGLLGFHSNGAVVTWLPLFLFTVLFGLSMDYHVFIVSRIKELVDRGVPNDEAVEQGDPRDRRHRDERGVRDGGGVLDLRHALDARHQADGRRARGRRAARRDDRARGAAAGDDEAARPLELVPAAQPQLAAAAAPRAGARVGDGGRLMVTRGLRTLLFLGVAVPIGAVGWRS